MGDYNVTVVEGFGYGYSDVSARERSNKNISSELHEVLGKLNISQPYILAGHSIAGFYMLDSDAGSPEAAAKIESLENLLKNVKHHEIVPLAGGHYLHWTQAKPMAETIRAFLATQ